MKLNPNPYQNMKSRLLYTAGFLALIFCGCKSNDTLTTKNTSVIEINNEDSIDNLKCRINTAQNTKRLGNNVRSIETENNFVVLNMTFTNESTATKTLYYSMITYHRGESKYEPSSAGMYTDNGFYFSLDIDAGLKKTTNIVFEIPSAFVSSDYIPVTEDLYSSNSIKIYLD